MNNEFDEINELIAEQTEAETAEQASDEIGEEPCGEQRSAVVGLPKVIIACIACLVCGALIALILVPNVLRMWIGGDTVYEKLVAVEKIVNENFKYIDQVDEDQLADMLAVGYIYGLGDPYSVYYNAEQFKDLQTSNSGQTYGIGISGVYYGGVYVVSVTKNSPAELAGLQKSDTIIAVNGVSVTADNYSEQIDAIRGEIGSEVKLTVKRGDENLEISAVRGEFVGESASGEMLGDIGYINIKTFNEATAPQFRDILASHIEAGAKSLVIDMRDNTGGLVNAACDVLDMLLGECELGYAVYQDGTRSVLARSDKASVDLPMSVIINSRSASSAELVAAALRDVAGAKLIGEKSFGKGIMQTTYPLADGSAVRVTVAEIYTAGGNQYHGKGLEVDVPVTYTEEQAQTWFLLEGENDPYIAAAIEVVK